MRLVLLVEWREAGMGRGWLLAAGCVGVSGVARLLSGWVQSRQWDRDKAVVWDTGRGSLCLCSCHCGT